LSAILSPAAALNLLQKHSPDGETWPTHCRQVARVARTLANAVAQKGHDLQPADVEAMALVHDIGRSVEHSYLHGWQGYVLLRDLGHAATGRGCIQHWLKGRGEQELRKSRIPADFLDEVLACLKPPEWLLEDSIVSVADSSVAGVEIVTLKERHDDLARRYGDSDWLRRHAELADQQAAQISEVIGRPVVEILAPLLGTPAE
jgi:hypothetical protein